MSIASWWNSIWKAPLTESDIDRLRSFNVLSDPDIDEQMADIINAHQSQTLFDTHIALVAT